MDTRRKVTAAILLLACGAGLGVVLRPWILRTVADVVPMSEEAWTEQVRLDAVSLLNVLRPDERLPASLHDQPEFWDAWNKRRRRYTRERLADLRTRLRDYLDFLNAEYAECADIYRAGIRPEQRSDAAEEARRRIRAGFGAFAATLERQAEEMREEAYRASPKVAGYAADEVNYVELQQGFLEWLPRAEARADELTAPLSD